MSQATEILGASRPSYVRVVGAVSAAHFVSHYYIILLAPLLPFVRAEYARELHRNRAGIRRIQHCVGSLADAGGIPGR